MLARGDRVAATLRRPDQLDDLVAKHGEQLWVRALDVTDTPALRRVVAEAFTSLAAEVEPFGIRTTLVEPGMIRSTFYEAATRVPVSDPYQGGPADREPIPLEQMPGDQAKVVAAMIDAALTPDPPRRLLLGSDAYRLVRGALADRIAAVEAQQDLAATTDTDGWQRV